MEASTVLNRRWAASALVVLALTGSPAFAGNIHSFFLGDVAAMTGGTVTAVSDDGSSLWYNPAGLATTDRDTLDVVGNVYMLRLRDWGKIMRVDGTPNPDVLIDANSTEVVVAPSTLAYGRNLGPGLSMGFGLFTPEVDTYALRLPLSFTDDAREVNAEATFEGSLTTYAGMFGIGYRVSPTLRLGASLGIYLQTITSEMRLFFDFTRFDVADTRGLGASEDRLSLTRLGMNLQVGVQLDVSDELTLGFVLRTPAVQIFESISGGKIVINQLEDPTLPTGGARTALFNPIDSSRLELGLYASVSGTAAIAWRPAPGTYFGAELELTAGSSDPSIGAERDFLWNARIGGTYALSKSMRLGAGLFTDRSAVPTLTEGGVDQTHYYGVAAGFHTETPINVRESDGAETLVFTSTFGVRYALGVGTALRAELRPDGVVTDPLMAELDLLFHEISLHVGSGLRF